MKIIVPLTLEFDAPFTPSHGEGDAANECEAACGLLAAKVSKWLGNYLSTREGIELVEGRATIELRSVGDPDEPEIAEGDETLADAVADDAKFHAEEEKF